jgi:hypothetical protein
MAVIGCDWLSLAMTCAWQDSPGALSVCRAAQEMKKNDEKRFVQEMAMANQLMDMPHWDLLANKACK